MNINSGQLVKQGILGLVILLLAFTGCFAIYKGVTLKSNVRYARYDHHQHFQLQKDHHPRFIKER